MSRGGEVSADHEDWMDDKEALLLSGPLHPPAQVVEADCRHCQAGLPYVPFGQPSPGGNYHQIHSAAPATPTDPARKPADEDGAEAHLGVNADRTYGHMCQDEHVRIGHNDSGEDERCPVCRERDRADAAFQAGAEEMREACAKDETIWPVLLRWAEKFAPSDVTTGDAHRLLTALKAALRALPIPESRS